MNRAVKKENGHLGDGKTGTGERPGRSVVITLTYFTIFLKIDFSFLIRKLYSNINIKLDC